MDTTQNRKRTTPAGTAVPAGQMVTLRPVGMSDLPILQAWDADPAIIALMGRRFDEQTPDDWFRSIRRQRTCRAWIIEAEQRAVGEMELAQINWRTGSAEIRICIGEKELWGQGIGLEAMTHALDLSFEELKLKTVYLRVFATNTRAIRLYERLGFRKEAMLAPSSRRQDPAPVLLMNLSGHRWAHRRAKVAG